MASAVLANTVDHVNQAWPAPDLILQCEGLVHCGRGAEALQASQLRIIHPNSIRSLADRMGEQAQCLSALVLLS